MINLLFGACVIVAGAYCYLKFYHPQPSREELNAMMVLFDTTKMCGRIQYVNKFESVYDGLRMEEDSENLYTARIVCSGTRHEFKEIAGAGDSIIKLPFSKI